MHEVASFFTASTADNRHERYLLKSKNLPLFH